MAMLYAVLLVFIVLLIWRINHPGDLRLNRNFVGRYVKDLRGQGPTRLQVSRLALGPAGADQAEERVYYSMVAGFADGSKRPLLAQIVYPLESLQRERERNSRPGADEMMIDPSSSPMAMQRGDYLERLKEDPFKDLTKEEQVLAAKKAQVDAELQGLRRLNQIGVFFPRLIAHDAKKLITLTEGVGTSRLDDLLQQSEQGGRLALLQSVLADLATFHDRGKDSVGFFPPGAGHFEKKIRDELQNSLSSWEKVGAPVSREEFFEIIDAAEPLFRTTEAEIGLRLVDSSPRAFFMQGKTANRISWDGVRSDVSAFDAIELVCDPATGLGAEDELSLFQYYLSHRDLSESETAEYEQQMTRLAVYYRLVLLGYLCQYRAAKLDRQGGIKYWGPGVISQAAARVMEEMASDPELAGLLERLRPALTIISRLD